MQHGAHKCINVLQVTLIIACTKNLIIKPNLHVQHTPLMAISIHELSFDKLIPILVERSPGYLYVSDFRSNFYLQFYLQ